MLVVDKRKTDLKAGSIDDQVHLFLAAVCKTDRIATEFHHISFRANLAMSEEIVELGIDNGMCFKKFVVGLGQTDSPMGSECDSNGKSRNDAPEPEREVPPEKTLATHIHRFAMEKFWQVVVTASRAVKCCGGMMCRLDCQITARIAGTNDQDASSLEQFRRLILSRMDYLAIESSWDCGPIRIPIVTICNNNTAVMSQLAARKLYSVMVVLRNNVLY